MTAAHTPGQQCDVCEGFCLRTPVNVRVILEATDDHLQAMQHYGHSGDLRAAMSAVDELTRSLQKLVDAVETRKPEHEGYLQLCAVEARDSLTMASGQGAAALTTTAKPATAQLSITLRQATKLLVFFGGHDTEVTVAYGLPQQPAGLYAWCTEYPEEGAEYLGPTEVDDDLAANGTHSSALLEVLAERQRQITDEGFTLQHDDDEHEPDDLADAGAAYALVAHFARTGIAAADVWPWDPASFKPREQRRNYVRATALMLAAVELIHRREAAQRARSRT